MSSRKERHKQRRHTERLIADAWQAFADREFALARKLALRATAEGPMNPKVWHEQGLLWAALGEEQLAVAAFEHALQIAPTFAAARAELVRRRGPEPAAEPTPILRAAPLATTVPAPHGERLASAPWERIRRELEVRGMARLPQLLTATEVTSLRELPVPAEDLGLRIWQLPRPAPEPLAEVRREILARTAPFTSQWLHGLGAPEPLGSWGQILPAGWVVEWQPGSPLPVERHEPGRGGLGLRLGIAVGPGPWHFLLTDLRPGKADHTRGLDLQVGDGVLFLSPSRPVWIGGALGLQPVRWGLVPAAAGRWLDLSLARLSG